MKRILVGALVLLCSAAAYAQVFTYRMGICLGTDMGIRIDRYLPDNHSVDFKNSSTGTVDILSKFTYKRFNFVPDCKISYATFGKFNHNATNELGFEMPEGSYLSISHDGNFYETITRPSYLYNKSDLSLFNLTVGLFVTYNFLLSQTGWFEAGSGAFYFRKRVKIEDYMAHDVYEYYGSSGSHLTQTQMDDYAFGETEREDGTVGESKTLFHMLAIPVTLQYNFQLGRYVELSPAFTVFFSQDVVYNLNLSLSFGPAKY